MKFHPLLSLCALLVVFSFCGTVSATDHTEYVSISSNGTLSNGYSGEPSVSADGRYVAFSSYANNLVTNDTNYQSDIFVRDSVSNVTERVSISSNGNEANSDCYNPSISGDGRYITFNSYANNLVLNDNNYYSDVFLHDRYLHTTIRISNSDTEEEVNGDSLAASISSDGRYVVFMSYATNLVLNDTNTFNDIFIYNISSGTTKRVSVTSTGGETNSNSFNPAISSDGRFVVFTSDANNLVANDTNGWLDIFVKDLKLNLITRISVSDGGEEGNGDSVQPSISGDGTCIAFTSYADNLSPNDGNYKSDIFVYNQLTKKIDRISINGEEINKDSHDPAISENGRYIVFIIGKSQPIVAKISNELNNVSFTDDRYVNGLFCYDTLFGTTKLISTSDEGEIANDYCNEPAINSDGSYVVYSSGADNLVGNDDNLSTDIFVYIKKSSPTSFPGTITPEIVKSGNIITIKAYSDDATHVTAFLFNETLNLTKQDDGKWLLYYNVPSTSSGIYDVFLTATYISGKSENLSLNFIIDNTPPTITGTITPHITKSEDTIIVNALSDPDTTSIWVSLCGENLEMHKNGSKLWDLYYYAPIKPDGNYPVLLTAIDIVGNQCTHLLNLTIDNTPPLITAALFPEIIKSFESLQITASACSDTAKIKALIFNRTYDLVKQSDGTWNLNYTVPNMPNGVYNIFLTATDNIGNRGLAYKINFKIYNPFDNLSPTISAVVTPDHFKIVNNIFPKNAFSTIIALSDPDTASITAIIHNQEFNMTRQSDGSWIFYYSIFGLQGGIYPILLIAKDISGNTGTLSTNLTISNGRPTINTFINPGKAKSGDTVTIIVSSDPDAQVVSVNNLDRKRVKFVKQVNGTWKCDFIVPKVEDRTYVLWINLFYGTGQTYGGYNTMIDDESSVCLTVDNTPPDITGSVSPNPIKSGDALKIKVFSNIWYRYTPDDTANITATIFGKKFNIPFSKYSGDLMGKLEYTIPQVSDGVYSVFLTAEDMVGNSKTISVNYTVDNTPPIITATITPNTLKFIDFANDRSVEIITRSSTDTKAIYAFIDNSWRVLKYLNGCWTNKFGVPHIVYVGIHTILLKAIDYAGNEATTSVSYYVYDNLGLGIGTGNSQGGSAGSRSGSSGSGENGGSSSGSNNGSNGDSTSTGGSNASNLLLFGLIMLFILIAIAGLFLVALFFGPELFIILTAIVGAAAILSIPFDVWDIINYLYNLIFTDVGLIETMLVLLALAGIILEAPVLLSLIALTILFIIVAMLLFKFL